ncbi:MAG: hypothetical protein ABIJ52_05550 [Pseudomonadota bacterium]
MIELEQMRREWVDVTRKNGFREGITDLLAHQYSEKTHFIFELLQNAEDALATEVEFRVESQRLVFSHNGERLFSDENVESITSIGKSTKQTDYTQIGKHGIGFKAVFAYTHTPRIHSGDKHFDIEDVVIPCLLTGNEVPTDLKPEETRIILPFDSDAILGVRRFRELVSAETARADISDALKKLNIRTLLFLRHIEEIRWTLVDGTEGAYLRESRSEPNRTSLRHVDVTDGVRTESWLVFEQETNVTDDGKDNECIVEVAFFVENGKVIPARNTELVVYFPTEKNTGLAFLIQGPFKTTKARDNIKLKDPANKELLETAAHLAADSLETLRDLKFLDVSSYLALPLQVPEDSFFHPVYERFRETLRTKSLLPAYDGTFIKASEAKLARGKELVELFLPGQLGLLFGKEKLCWLDVSITESGTLADLHTYLIGRKKYQGSKDWEIEPLWDGLQVDADTLAPKLTAVFLGRQPMPWLVEFIQYAAQGASAIKRTPFIRLVSGKQVSLPASAEMIRPAWFAPQNAAGLNLSVFLLVHPELAANGDIRKFLEKEGIREIDAVAIVEKSILPKYQDINPCFDESTYRVDLCRIREAYGKANDTERAQLNTSLNKYGWLACIHASGNAPDIIVWKKPGASDLFEKTAAYEIWFDGLENVNAYFLHSSVIEILNGAVASLAKTTTALTTNLSTNEYTISLSNEYYRNHKQGLNGFNPNATIVGIKSALAANWTQDRSKVLWKALLSDPLKIISGETQSSRNRQKLDKAPKKIEYTDVGNLCRNQAWLPDKSGKWRMPSELLLNDLSEGFESTSIAAKELAEKIGMRQPEREQALEYVTGGDAKFKMLIKHYQSASDHEREKFLKIIPHELSEPVPSFKDGLKNLGRPQKGIIEHGDIERSPVSDPGSYQGNLIGRVETGIEEHQSTPRKITFSPVRDLPSNAEARHFLYEQYKGCCQITGTTFPKASRNTDGMAENYFEACSLLSYGNADYLNDAGNMLCVSADTMAKFKYASVEFIENPEDAIETFKANGEQAESVSVKIQLAGEECSIKWSQRHFMRLVALYEKA